MIEKPVVLQCLADLECGSGGYPVPAAPGCQAKFLENQQLTLLSQRVRLDVRIEDVTLIADRSKVRLILENLVSNAVKYSPKGGTIHLRARTAGELLELDVADSGPGIPVEDRAHVLRAFYTGRASKKLGGQKAPASGFLSCSNSSPRTAAPCRSWTANLPRCPFSASVMPSRPVNIEPKEQAHAA